MSPEEAGKIARLRAMAYSAGIIIDYGNTSDNENKDKA